MNDETPAPENKLALLEDRIAQIAVRLDGFVPAAELQARVEDKAKLIVMEHLAPFSGQFQRHEEIWTDLTDQFGKQVMLNARLSVMLDQIQQERITNRENASKALDLAQKAVELAQVNSARTESFMMQFTGENGLFADMRQTRAEVEDIESILRLYKEALNFFIGVFKSNIFKIIVGVLLGGGGALALFGQQIMKLFTP